MNVRLSVPPDVLANVEQRWPEIANEWAACLEVELRGLCRTHGATVRGVLPARYGYVVAADSPGGQLILRSSPDPHGDDQAAVAAALANLGIAPRVYQISTSAHGTWTVLDRVTPGTSLNRADPAKLDARALFLPLAPMRDQPPPRQGMSSILDWLRDRLEDEALTDLRPGTVVAPEAERSAALEILADLSRTHIPALCHGDTSSGNIIADGPDRWMFIDPRGMAGDYLYDVAVLITRLGRSRKINAVLTEASAFVEVAPERLLAWIAIVNAARV